MLIADISHSCRRVVLGKCDPLLVSSARLLKGPDTRAKSGEFTTGVDRNEGMHSVLCSSAVNLQTTNRPDN